MAGESRSSSASRAAARQHTAADALRDRFLGNYARLAAAARTGEMLDAQPRNLEAYRRMTPGERLQLALRMTRENTPYLFAGSEETVARRFELLRRQNDERNRRMLEAFARAENYHAGR